MFIVTILNKAKFPCDILYTNKWCNEALAMWKLYHDTTQHPHEQPRGQITCLRSPVNTSPLQPRAVIALTWHAAHFLSCVLQYMYTFLSSLLEKRLTKQSQFNTFLCLLSTCTRVKGKRYNAMDGENWEQCMAYETPLHLGSRKGRKSRHCFY